MYGSPKASFTTGLSAPPISSDPLPAPMCSPVWQVMSPSRINFPINFSSVCAVCELIVGSVSLFVVGDDGFEKIAEAFVTFGVVLARHLQQQAFERIETAQRVSRDGISKPRAQHHELLLPLALRSAHRAAHGIVQAAQLASGAGIHVAHAADYGVGLVVQVQRIRDQLFDIDISEAFETAAVARTSAAATIVPTGTSTFAPSALRTATTLPAALTFAATMTFTPAVPALSFAPAILATTF